MIAKIITSERIKNLNFHYLISFSILSIITLMLLIQPDIGQSVLLVCTWISLIFVSGFNIIYISFLILIIFTLLLFWITLIAPDRFNYIISRLTSFMDPEKSGNFQSQKAIDAIKQGGLKGQGMGEGILKR